METQQTPTDFRLYLQGELVRRCQKNPAYSLRSFARALEIDFSTLSKILSGKRKLGPKTIARLASRLSLSPDETAAFVTGQVLVPAQSPVLQTENYHQHTADAFQVIADWHHYAMLALIQTEAFKPSHRWIAQSLGISVAEVNDSVERLVRLGLLGIDSKGRWKDLTGGASTTIGNDFTNAAFRKLQRQVLEKALAAIDDVPFEERDQSSMTFAADSSLLPEAQKRIRKFRRELARFLMQGKKRDRVFNMSVSLYPLSKKEI